LFGGLKGYQNNMIKFTVLPNEISGDKCHDFGRSKKCKYIEDGMIHHGIIFCKRYKEHGIHPEPIFENKGDLNERIVGWRKIPECITNIQAGKIDADVDFTVVCDAFVLREPND
jgi:hypothetical protein